MTGDRTGGRGASKRPLRRRAYLAAVAATALAGCSGSDGDSSTDGEGSAQEDSGDVADGSTGDTGSGDDGTPEPRIASIDLEPATVRQTRPATTSVDVRNDGDATADVDVQVAVDGEVLDSKSVSVAPGASETVSVEHAFDAVGDHEVAASASTAGEIRDRGSTTVAVERYPASFVETEGTDFVLEGSTYRFLGANSNHLPVAQWGESYVDRWLDYVADRGVSVVRTWAFTPGWTDASVHAGPGNLREEWFEHLDYVIAAAKRRDVRLILPLIQNWATAEQPPSPAAYADWSDTAETRNDFFTDEQANGYFRNYVEHVLTRENRITGLAYRDDPTIFMWEVGNEMEYHGDRRGESLAEWYDATAAHVTSIDDAHLVGSGMHGATGDTYQDWNVRNAYVESHRSEHVDACSFHDYPVYEWDGINERGHDAFAEYVREHVRKAHEQVGKPAYLGEFGVHVDTGTEYDLAKRNAYLETGFEAAGETGLNGVALWAPDLHDPTTGTTYTHENDPLAIFPDDESTWAVVEEYRASLSE
ncbi:Mannan endo-1,4-beta-mannosidase [Salinarchaeum sp. Harcht-Bsk1]|uniref:cellulase family glycosylhydrolase n=1 Tax=Salinarchaeum sp. Harcht-Bsk1 TaxID=1333523 RepID=UPI0003422B33|nr:cellulase family glycosylhydrolase [Salinarchaeum sp. Harcht-Bsk1]AGN01025.1 Mannan endo-1,4-beta-mannosidase [Salinarchaeum sp. Harcht-Bsk1]